MDDVERSKVALSVLNESHSANVVSSSQVAEVSLGRRKQYLAPA